MIGKANLSDSRMCNINVQCIWCKHFEGNRHLKPKRFSFIAGIEMTENVFKYWEYPCYFHVQIGQIFINESNVISNPIYVTLNVHDFPLRTTITIILVAVFLFFFFRLIPSNQFPEIDWHEETPAWLFTWSFNCKLSIFGLEKRENKKRLTNEFYIKHSIWCTFRGKMRYLHIQNMARLLVCTSVCSFAFSLPLSLATFQIGRSAQFAG